MSLGNDFHFKISTGGKTYEFDLRTAQMGSGRFSIIPKNEADATAINMLLQRAFEENPSTVEELSRGLKHIPSVTHVSAHPISKTHRVGIQSLQTEGAKKTVKSKRIQAAEGFLQKLKKKDEFSGVILVQQGKESAMQAFSPKGIEQARFDLDTPFNIASVGKWFTGIAVLQLVEQGKLDLEQPVWKYLLDPSDYQLLGTHSSHSEYRSSLPQNEKDMGKLIEDIKKSGITIRQLLTMKSGLEDGDPIDKEKPRTFLDPEGINKERYSNYGYQLLARVIQNQSGITFSEYIKDNILLKSGISSENAARAVYDVESNDYQSLQNAPDQFQKSDNGYSKLTDRIIPSTDGNGCYRMNAKDLLTVSRSIMETEDILSSSIKTKMLEGALGIYNKSGQSVGYKSKFYGKPGEDLGMSAGLDIIEGEEGFTYSIILSNQGDGNKCRGDLRNTMLGPRIDKP